MTEKYNYMISCGNINIGNISVGNLKLYDTLVVGSSNVFTATSQVIQNSAGNIELCVAANAGEYSFDSLVGDAIIRSLSGRRLILQSGSSGSTIIISSSGNLTINGATSSAWNPEHIMFNNSSSNPAVLALLAPNMPSTFPNNYASFTIGRSLEYANSATWSFYYAGNGNSANAFQINFWGVGGGVYLTPGSTSWTAVSDRTLKTNFEDIETPLTKICSIKGTYYKFLTDNETQRRRVGVIAQDVQAVLPEIVCAVQDGKLGVNYTELVPLLIEGIKEQKKMVEQHQEEINKLKQFIESK